MKLSTDRFLTTHVGSLPRPDDLRELLLAQDGGTLPDATALFARTETAVYDVVERQVAAGIEIVSDGEYGKNSFVHYAKHRLSGIETITSEPLRGSGPVSLDDREFPDWAESRKLLTAGPAANTPVCCNAAVVYANQAPLERDIANLLAAVEATNPEESFMNAASPGVLVNFIPDRFYEDEEAYLEALTEAMATEYEAIYAAGFLLQIDAPDLAMARHQMHHDKTEAEFLKIAARNVEAINYATRNIPPDAMRLHVCWGNYAGPHKSDLEVRRILPILLDARPQAISFEGANPRHEHEWEDWKDAGVPEDKVLIPGIVDSATNFVEHPRLVAQRIGRYAEFVGRERVIAGADCGFGTFGKSSMVFESVAWAKLTALVEGARIASHRHWS